MFKTLTKDFIENPVLEMDTSCPTDEIILFGKKYRMHKDEWKKHIHLKCTNCCDAKCDFCIEKDTRFDRNNKEMFMHSASVLIDQMHNQGHLKTVSITGGEPTVFDGLNNLISIVNLYPVKLFSMNTNGRLLNVIEPFTFNGWVNISKHSICDANIFKRDFEVTSQMVYEFKRLQPNAKVRFQCVLGVENGLKDLCEINKFMQEYKYVVDDFSFRSLIINDKHGEVPELFKDLRKCLFDSGMCIEQTIQDYYVYEVFEEGSTKITISWSNMELLRQYNESHDDNFLEEIIVHPDGIISGSWNKKSLIIYNPYERN